MHPFTVALAPSASTEDGVLAVTPAMPVSANEDAGVSGAVENPKSHRPVAARQPSLPGFLVSCVLERVTGIEPA